MNTKKNQRYYETEKRIFDVFTDLITRKEVEHITIQEICGLAGINRSSFYIHFTDVYDLMEKLEYYTMMRSGEFFSSPEDIDFKERFTRFFEFIQEHQTFFRAYLNNQNQMHVLDGFIQGETASSAYHQLIDRLGYQNDRELGYHNAFFKAGITALVREWLNGGCTESPKELSDILEREYDPEKQRLF